MQVAPIADNFRRPKGMVQLVLRDLAGNVVAFRRANIVTDVARAQVADWAAQDFTEKINEISVGDGGHDPGDPNIPIPPTEGDTALDNETARKTVATITNPTVTDTRLSGMKRLLLQTLAGWRYKTETYAFPAELRVFQHFFSYQRPETTGF